MIVPLFLKKHENIKENLNSYNPIGDFPIHA